jgi:hypothetical protein
MDIIENVNIADSKIGGYIIVKDSSGNIILRKDNMIVENGRKFIRDKFIASAIKISSEYLGTYNTYSLTQIAFGSDGTASQKTMTSLVNELIRTEITQTNLRIVDNSFQIQIKAIVDRVNSAEGINISEIGLVIEELDEGVSTGTETLFSRVVFDTIPVAAGEIYEVNYYIYF